MQREDYEITEITSNTESEAEEEEDEEFDNYSNDSEDFDNILKFYQNEIKGRGFSSSNRLPRSVSLLVGEANKLYLEKNFEEAIEICCEAIKVYPENPEPYHLLSVIYEEMGDKKKSVDFLFIETQLNYKSDINSWWKLADKFFDLRLFKNAGYCYGRALKCDKNNVTLLFKKARCYDRLKDTRGAIKYYKKIYNIVNSQKEVVIKLAKLYSKLNQHLKAICLLIDYYIRNEENADLDVANIICELLSSKEMHLECCYFIELLALENEDLNDFLVICKTLLEEGMELRDTDDYKKQLELKISKKKLEKIKEKTPIDILISYAESLLKVGRVDNSVLIMEFLENLDKDEYYDILLDLIELYSEAKKYNDALRVCIKVIESDNIEDKSLIMLKIGLLYGKMGMKTKEVESYNQALVLNPTNDKVRFRLSELYETQGKIKQALEILCSGKEEQHQLEDFDGTFEIEESREEAHQEIFSQNEEEEEDINKQYLGKRDFKATELDDLDQTNSFIKTHHIDINNETLEEKQERIAKIKKLLEDIKYEETYNEKTKRRMENLIELNHEFFLNQQRKIENTVDRFNLDRLLLDFRRCEINMKSSDDDFFNSAKTCILNSLRLETAKKDISNSIYSKLLRESKGKIRNSLKEDFPKDELNSLFIFKRKKSKVDDKFESIFKDSKNKSRVAKRMSEKMITRMSTVSSTITLEKYIEILSKAIKVFYRKKKFRLLAELCDNLLNLREMFSGECDFTAEFFICGFLVNTKLKNYEKSYVFFRYISKSLLDVNHNVEFKNSLLQKIGYNFSTDDIIVLCFSTIHLLFANFKTYSSQSRAFFQKFREQFEEKSMMKYANHLASIIYIYSGSLDQSRSYIEKNYKKKGDNVLYDLMLGFCYLMDSTNRRNLDKITSLEKSFDFFKKYELSRSKEGGILSESFGNGSCEEAYYNIARAFSHVNCPDMALKMLKKARNLTESKIIESNRAFIEEFKEEMGVENVTVDMFTEEDLEEKKAREEKLKESGVYYNAAFNEMIWYKLTNNKKMENYMIENYLTFDEI